MVRGMEQEVCLNICTYQKIQPKRPTPKKYEVETSYIRYFIKLKVSLQTAS